MLKLLITGGSGFIGRNLAEQYASTYAVSAPTRHQLDLTDEVAVRAYLAANRFDVVLHTATGRTNRKTVTPNLFRNNTRMFFNFARNMHLCGRLIHFGSGAEFDRRAYQPLMPESYFDTSVPEDDYGFAKYVAAQYTGQTPNIYNLRLFGVFGKYEAWDVRFVSNAICRGLYNLPITLRQNIRFDYLYIDDLARLTHHFIQNKPKFPTYNVCTGRSHEILSLAHTVAANFPAPPEIRVANEGLGREYSGNNSRLLEEVGPFTFEPIEDSIRKLYTWYSGNRNAIDPEQLRFDD